MMAAIPVVTHSSFRRKPESDVLRPAGFLDSGLRRNDKLFMMSTQVVENDD
jgi:hypothetical protein